MPGLYEKVINPEDGVSTAYTAFASATSQAAAVLLVIFTADRQMLEVDNNTDANFWLCQGLTGPKLAFIRAGGVQMLDFGSDKSIFASGTKLYAFCPNGAPTSASGASGFTIACMV